MADFKAVLFVALSVIFYCVESKVYDRCEFAYQLLKYGVPKWQIPTWTCIAQHESQFGTSQINNYSGDHGIFQISQLYWCSTDNIPGKGCKKTCADFRDDYIGDDISCALHIYNEHQRIFGNGFSAWTVYNPYCSGDTSYYTQGCF